jgi:peptidoglycan/LPS O-acetylase OafA/YrhL
VPGAAQPKPNVRKTLDTTLVPVRAQSLRVFLWHRFVRLFPAHATVLLGLMALIVFARSAGIDFNEPQNWNYQDLPYHFLMVHAWGTTDIAGWNAPSWSISAEWFAYLLFPALAIGALALPQRAALPLAFATVLIAAVLFSLRGWIIEWAWLGPPALIRVGSEFCCGLLLYRATRSNRVGLSPRLSDGLMCGGLLGLCVGAIVSVSDFVLIGLIAALITGVSGPGKSVRAVFGCKPVVWLGEISYSIYLVHFPVLLVLRHGAEHVFGRQLTEFQAVRLIMFLVNLGLVIGAASLMYYLVEYPTRKRLRTCLASLTGSHQRQTLAAIFW